MHDGRFATLEDVVEFYSNEIVAHPNNHIAEMLSFPLPFRGFRYSDEEKAALVACMHTLTDTVLLTHPKWSDPFVPVTNTANHDPLDFHWNVFPNPAAQEVFVSWPVAVSSDVEVYLKNLNGQIMRQLHATGGSYRIPLTGLPAGVYALSLQSGKRQSVKLVVIK